MGYKLPIPERLKAIGCPDEFTTKSKVISDLQIFRDKNYYNIIEITLGLDRKSIDNLPSSKTEFYRCPVFKYFNDTIDDARKNSKYSWKKISGIYNHLLENKFSIMDNNIHKSKELFAVESLLLLYRFDEFNMTWDEAIKKVAYNELLKNIISMIPEHYFGYFTDLNFEERNQAMYEAYQEIPDDVPLYKNKRSQLIENKLKTKQQYNQRKLEKANKDISTIASNQTKCKYFGEVLKNECINMNSKQAKSKLIQCKYRLTAISDKENILMRFLQKQTPEVTRAKNSRSIGKRKFNQERIKEYILANPEASNHFIAKKLSVSPHTVKTIRSKLEDLKSMS